MGNIEYYRGYAIMFNPVSSMYYFYVGRYTSSRKLVFDTYEGAIEKIDEMAGKK